MNKCIMCKQYFTQKTNYKRHLTQCNQKLYKFSCNICSIVFKFVDEYNIHNKNVHEKGKHLSSTPINNDIKQVDKFVYLCPFCDEEFNDSIKWHTHCKNHLNPICVCDMKFHDRKTLEKHFKIHYKHQSVQTDISYNKTENGTDGEYFNNGITNKLSEINGSAFHQVLVDDQVNANDFSMLDNVKIELSEKSDNENDNFEDDSFMDTELNKNIPANHELLIKNYKETKCGICSESVTDIFRSINDVVKEYNIFNGCICIICYRYFRNIRLYKKHQYFHFDNNSKETSIACRNCCNTNEQYFITTDLTKLECHMCPRSFKTSLKLRMHKRSHLDRCVYKCPTCRRQIIGHSKFVKHMYDHRHVRTKMMGLFQCSMCDKSFNSKSSIIPHLKNHIATARLKCPQCPQTLKSKGSLVQHLQLHTGVKNFSCDFCGRMFHRKTNLIKHIRTHTKEKPYECSVCLKMFPYNSGLTTHMRIHTGERPFKCTACDKTYKDYSDLRRHKRIHGGVEKKFECDLCSMKFYENKQVRQHKFTTHNVAFK